MPAHSLIGRDHPAALLRERLRRTVSSHGGVTLVSGEAGIGKTALVTEVVGEFPAADALVLTATAWSGDGTPGLWPWVQILRGLRRAGWAQVDAALAHLIGETHAPTPPATPLFRLGDAVTEALLAACAERAVFVVIDDLHAADAASLALLAFVARHSWFERIAVVATVRAAEIDRPDHPSHTAFADIAATAHTIELGGLDPSDTAALIAALTGQAPPERIAATAHALTGGNPFLVDQVARLWQTGNPIDTLTPGVRHTLEARLAPLAPATVEVLTTAALLGRSFAVPALAATTDAVGRVDSSLDASGAVGAAASGAAVVGAGANGAAASDAEVDGALAEAVRARLIVAERDGRYRFAHDLIRETLGARAGSAGSSARHAAILTALERLPRAVSGATAADLAHHADLAGDAVDPERTVRLLLDAAADACGRLAAAEVAGHYGRALALLPPERTALRDTVILGMAAAQQDAGELGAARRTFHAALDDARARGAAELFARAALGLHELGMPDPEREGRREIALMDTASGMLRAERPPADALAVRVRAAGLRVRVHTGLPFDRTEIERDSAETLALARESEDPTALTAALLARHDAVWRPGTARERLALAGELAVADPLDRDDTAVQAALLRATALLELGDPRAHAELTALAARADRSAQPRHRFVARSRTGALAMLCGRFTNARTDIDEAYALGERLGEVDRIPLWLEQRWALALFTENLSDADGFLARYRELAGDYTTVPEVITAANHGDIAGVTARLDAVEAMYTRYPAHFHAGILVAQAHAAVVVADEGLRETVRARLFPLREYWAVVAGGGVVYGPYAYWLGRVCQASGDPDGAVEHFTAAAEAAHRLRADPWRSAARHRLRLLAHRPGHSLAAREPQLDNEFRFDGSVWVLRFAGHTAHLSDAKGLRDLHTLLGHPGHDISSLELFGAPDAGVVRAATKLGADPLLDDTAKTAYRHRLDTLDAEIERALARGDDERASRLDGERAALLEQLRVAAGLGGRTRRLGDDAERARKTVSSRVRDSLRRVARVHPELAEHLRAGVALGTVCRYQPARDVAWRL
ncbi:AAA family ATPase [Nocardia puris]|uniref:ATP-binding protein n=1 Tax=Nocardia puris TaxID=208602 RepID=UPI0018952EB6|nr:AAA family ATPase [Nocardia puris]MBF6210329.1 AAA family ATPase [Nocardia puris]MBF6367404.1 AAA family ATPase [Nocardia puris]MBF6457589.1 AAA family ATPase [Nocardia puris]